MVFQLRLWRLPEGKILNSMLVEINDEGDMVPVLERDRTKHATGKSRGECSKTGTQDSVRTHGEPRGPVCCSEMASQKGGGWAEGEDELELV